MYFKQVNYIVCELYRNKAVILKMIYNKSAAQKFKAMSM